MSSIHVGRSSLRRRSGVWSSLALYVESSRCGQMIYSVQRTLCIRSEILSARKYVDRQLGIYLIYLTCATCKHVYLITRG